MVQTLAKHHQVWALTSHTHRDAIAAELQKNPIPNLEFVYFDPFGWVYDWSQEGKKSQWDVYLHYYLWQIQAYFVGRSLHHQHQFDLVHHVTYVKYSNPSFLSLLPIPFFWGPVGGAEYAPRAFWRNFSRREKLYELLRTGARYWGELDPFVHLTARRSRWAWGTTAETTARLAALGATAVATLPAISMNPAEIVQLVNLPLPPPQPVRFISMGRLLHWKGFYLGLQAFAQAQLPDAEYWILGDGPQRQLLEAMAEELGVAQQVKFLGKLDRAHALAKLGECHVLVHPSLHDSGGWVCLEAMAAGRPVVCLDLGGPGSQVTAETGFKVAAEHPDQAVQELAAAMVTLAQDAALRQRLGQAGQIRVKECFDWEAKVLSQMEIYQKVLSEMC
jgi:glycosyltransferase involved in cell wall biosynthesis